jgi:hypothetical protein
MFLSSRRFLLCTIATISFLGFLSQDAQAQDLDEASLVGLIVDQRGDPVADARIETIPIGNGSRRTVRSSVKGLFVLMELVPGIYRVRISAPGFKEHTSDELSMKATGTFRMKVTIGPSEISEEVSVRLDTDYRIEMDRVTLGDSLFIKDFLDIPTSSRDPIELLFLFAGVTEESLATRDLAEDVASNHRTTPLEQGVASIGGGTSYSNNFTIDGLDNNDDRTSRERFSPPLDSIEEVQVITHQYSAEYGRASGGRVNFRTRSGSARWRGSIGLRLRDERLNANTWRNKQRGIDRPRLRERKPAATFGGPLGPSRYRLFFFIGYENSLLEDTTQIETYVPLTGNPRFPLPSPTSNESFCEVADLGACTGKLAAAAWISPFELRLPTPDTAHSINARTDHRFVSLGDFSIGFQIGRKTGRRTAATTVTRLTEALQNRNAHSEAINISLNRSVGSKTVVNIRTQWSRMTPSYRSRTPDEPVVLIAYRNPQTDAAQTLIAGNSTASTLQNFSDTRIETRKQLQVGVTSVIGRSVIRSGTDIQYISSFAKSLSDSSGTFNFASFHSFGVGKLSRYRQNFGTDSRVANRYLGFYGMNESRMADNLNLSFGVRYEAEAAVRDRDNFGPRIGIAWDPLSNGRTVFRSGFGIFYNRVLLRTVADYVRSERGDLAFFDSNLIGNSATDFRRVRVLTEIASRFPSGFASPEELRALLNGINCAATTGFEPCSTELGFAGSSSSVPTRRVEAGIQIPRSVVWSASYEISIGKKSFLEISFSSNSTRNLWRERNVNLPKLPAGFSDWTGYLLQNPFVFTNSNGNTRTYRFYLGDPMIGSAVSTSPGGSSSCSTTATVTCHVNLNSFGSTATRPSTATANSGNSIGSPIGIALAAIDRFRPVPETGDVSSISSIGRADSNFLSLIFRTSGFKRDGFLLSGRGSYSFGVQRDDGLNNTSNAEIDGDFGREYARSLADRRHRFTLAGTMEVPRHLGGLRTSVAFRYGSSAPFNLGIGADRNLDGSSTDRPDFNGRLPDIRWRKPGSEFPADLLANFALPPIGSASGSLPRNAGHGPSLLMVDFGIARIFRLGERMSLRPSIESGNLMNLTRFSFGAEYINFSAFGPNATASQIQSLENFLVPTRTIRPRDVRIALKIDFH